jgi:hypothetical protein
VNRSTPGRVSGAGVLRVHDRRITCPPQVYDRSTCAADEQPDEEHGRRTTRGRRVRIGATTWQRIGAPAWQAPACHRRRYHGGAAVCTGTLIGLDRAVTGSAVPYIPAAPAALAATVVAALTFAAIMTSFAAMSRHPA